MKLFNLLSNAIIWRVNFYSKLLREKKIDRKEKRKNSYNERHAPPSLNDFERIILEDIKKDGIHITHIDNFDAEGSFMALCDKISEGADNWPFDITSSFRTFAPNEAVLKHLGLAKWALQPSIVNIAKNYLGSGIAYSKLCLISRDKGDSRQAESRHWHLDYDDDKILRIIIYLTDVDENTGPFQFIRKSRIDNKLLDAKRRKKDWRVSDDDFEKVTGEKGWESAIGKKGTMIICDTCNIYHRGSPNILKPRNVFWCSINSFYPKSPHICWPNFKIETINAIKSKYPEIDVEPLFNVRKYYSKKNILLRNPHFDVNLLKERPPL